MSEIRGVNVSPVNGLKAEISAFKIQLEYCAVNHPDSWSVSVNTRHSGKLLNTDLRQICWFCERVTEKPQKIQSIFYILSADSTMLTNDR